MAARRSKNERSCADERRKVYRDRRVLAPKKKIEVLLSSYFLSYIVPRKTIYGNLAKLIAHSKRVQSSFLASRRYLSELFWRIENKGISP